MSSRPANQKQQKLTKQRRSEPLKKFFLFLRLPAEIRIQIWHLFMTISSRLIEIEYGPDFREGYEMPTDYLIVGKHG
jgi:hypothetical protein